MSLAGIIRLSAHAVLVALLLFFVWAVWRCLTLYAQKKRGVPPRDRRREALLWVFVFYFICLYQITVFRYGINQNLWFAWQNSLDSVNLTPFVHTIKLYHAYTKWFFYYNLIGNVLWFVPFGALLPVVGKRHGFWFTALMGFCCSVSIEVLQFVFATGISDVDDVIFNTTGTVIGFVVYLGVRTVYRAGRKPN